MAIEAREAGVARLREGPTAPDLGAKAMRLLMKTLDRIERFPESFHMGTWMSHDAEVRRRRGVPEGYCGTAACFAGHVTLAAGAPPQWLYQARDRKLPDWLRKMAREQHGENIETSLVAIKLLGLTGAQADRLFYTNRWPTALRLRYERAEAKDDHRVMARALRARVKHWLRTGQ